MPSRENEKSSPLKQHTASQTVEINWAFPSLFIFPSLCSVTYFSWFLVFVIYLFIVLFLKNFDSDFGSWQPLFSWVTLASASPLTAAPVSLSGSDSQALAQVNTCGMIEPYSMASVSN